jgi:hypothetical protein
MLPTNVKPLFSEKKLKKGLKYMEKLWAQGHTPLLIKLHLFLTWYILLGCNLTHTGKFFCWSRNYTVFFHQKYLGLKNMLPVRRLFKKIEHRFPPKKFFYNFHALWKELGLKPTFAPKDHLILIDLWKTGFPLEMLIPSYLLWNMRKNKPRSWYLEKMKLKHRNSFRNHLNFCIKNQSKTRYWLGPLKPTLNDWDWPTRPGRPKRMEFSN